MTALEYGAGTGIASFLLKYYLKEITLMDHCAEMINFPFLFFPQSVLKDSLIQTASLIYAFLVVLKPKGQ